jgi:FAD/FMN-containing dehydrogenase
VGLTAPDDVTALPDGTLPAVNRLESLLMDLLEDGQILDAVVCKSEGQRREMWTRREHAFETTVSRGMPVNNDISVAVDKVETFLTLMDTRLPAVFPKAQSMTVSHLGDGNLHYSVWTDPDTRAAVGHEDYDRVLEIVEDTVLELGGSFSAEHGIGVTKLGSMKRRKNKAALAAMWAIKSALDPNNILNPGKVLPPQ